MIAFRKEDNKIIATYSTRSESIDWLYEKFENDEDYSDFPVLMLLIVRNLKDLSCLLTADKYFWSFIDYIINFMFVNRGGTLIELKMNQ